MTKTVIYDGRLIPESPFAAYIYGPNDTQKLVHNWADYQKEIASGLWFTYKKDVPKVAHKSKS